jgi:hypothetical protein
MKSQGVVRRGGWMGEVVEMERGEARGIRGLYSVEWEWNRGLSF